MQNIRYFDHAATTAIETRVLNEMMPYLTENFGNASSMYQIGKKNKEAINLARSRVANCLKCNPNEIYFTSRWNRKRQFNYQRNCYRQSKAWKPYYYNQNRASSGFEYLRISGKIYGFSRHIFECR